MKTCTKCNISYEDDKKYCKKCGSLLFAEQNIEPKEVAKKSVYEDRLKAEPLNIDILHEYAQFLFNNLLFKEAITVSLKILAINENDVVAKELLFKSYNKLNLLEDASEIGKQLLSEKPTDIFLLEELARISSELRHSDTAVEYLDKILSLQSANSNALYNKARILLEKNQIEKAIEFFKKSYKEGQRGRITSIYVCIDMAINADYLSAINLLVPILSDENIIQNDLDNNRGYLYLAYSLSKSNANLSEINKWFSLIDYQVLKKSYNISDEQILAKTILLIFNANLNSVESSNAKYTIGNLINTYLYAKNTYFTNNTNSVISDIWYIIGIKQAELKLYSDSVNSFKMALDLMPDEKKYKEKYVEFKEIFNDKIRKNKKRKIIAFVFAIIAIIIIVVSILTYNNFKESKAWNLAKSTNTFSSYQDYLNVYPSGKYFIEANNMQEEALWNEAQNNSSLDLTNNYISLYGNGKHTSEAMSMKEDLIWNETKRQNTLDAYESYTNNYPKGKYIKIFNFRSPDGSVNGIYRYCGEIANDKRNGKGIGIRETDNKDWDGKYSGNWKNDITNGYGKFIFSDGGIYEGDFVNGSIEGHGKFTYTNGDIYEGEWVSNKREGFGKLYWHSDGSDGDIYEGYFKNNLKSGTCKFYKKSLDKWFSGTLENDRGTLFSGDGYWVNF